MTSIAAWTTWLIPYMCRMLMGIPMINLSANAAFGVALIGDDVISLALYLRGMQAGCNHPRPRPLTRPVNHLAYVDNIHPTLVSPKSDLQGDVRPRSGIKTFARERLLYSVPVNNDR